MILFNVRKLECEYTVSLCNPAADILSIDRKKMLVQYNRTCAELGVSDLPPNNHDIK